MKDIDKNSRTIRMINIILLSLAGLIVGISLIGTIIVFAGSNNSRSGQNRVIHEDDIRVFSNMGRIRIPLANSSMLILSIAFPYSAADITFSEELASKIGDFKSIAIDYFSSLPAESLIQLDEESAKQEILKRYNNNLRLGRINALYFTEVTIID